LALADKTHVLFIQSQAAFGADSLIHAEIMQHLPRDHFVVHVACTRGDGVDEPLSLSKLRKLTDVHLRLTDFAPGFSRRTLREALQGIGALVTFPRDLLALRKYIIENNVRILHATEKPRDALYAYLMGKLTPAKSIIHVHVKWSEEYSRPAKVSIRHADAALAISRYVHATIVDMGTPAERVFTVLNALDATNWNPEAADGKKVRREFGFADDTLVLSSISRLFSWKGTKELIQALAIVRPQFPDVRLMVVGADELYVHGSSFTTELKKLVAELGLTDNVVFTGQRSDVANILAASDVFTMPSFEEPFGVVFLEAMAMAKPVIAINNGGTPEVVADGETGLLSPAWDINCLAENIIRLLRDAELRKNMGERGRRRVLEQFTPQRMAREVGDVYQRVMAL
jgi:glycosyltransferase involved in cell wall biosynthesis